MSDPWTLRPDGMPSELSIEAYLLGEADADERARIEAYAAAHPAFAEALEVRRAGFAALPMAQPDLMRSRVLSTLQPPKRRLPGWLWALGALAGASLATVFLLAPERGPGPDTFIAKGGTPGLEMFRDSPTGAVAVFDGDAVHPGDRIRFRPLFPAGFPEGGHLIVVGAEDGGLFAYAPAAKTRAVPRSALGTDGLFQGAARLDAQVGPATAHIVWCPQPFELADLQMGEELRAPEGCRLGQLRFAREP